MNSPQFEIGPASVPAKESNFGWLFLAFVFLVLIGGQLAYYLRRDSTGEQAVFAAETRVAEALELDKPTASFDKPVPKAIRESARSVVAAEIEKLRDNPSVEPGVVDYVETVWNHAVGLPVPQGNLERMAKSDSERWKAAAKIYGSEAYEPAELIKPFQAKTLTDRLVRMDAYLLAGFEPPADRKGGPTSLLVGGVLLFGLVAGTGIALIGLFSVARGVWSLDSHPAGKLAPAEASSMALRAGLLLIAMFGGQVVGGYLGAMMRLRDPYSGILGFAVAGALYWVIVTGKVDGYTSSFRKIGFRSQRLGADIVWGVLGAIANLPLMLASIVLSRSLFSWLPDPEHPIQRELLSGPPTEQLIGILFAAIILAPLFEETAFRGVLLPALISKLKSPAAAIIICGLLFAAIHPTGIPAWLTLAEIGAMAALLTCIRGSLVPALVMHAVHNGMLMLLTLLVMPAGP